MDTKNISFSIILLALSIAFCGFWIGIKLDSKQENIISGSNDHPLMTLEETAAYLRLPPNVLEQIIIQQTKLRGNSFNTYDYIPFVVLNGNRYFMKSEIDKWLVQSDYKVFNP